MPDILMAPITGPSAWKGPELAGDPSWIRHLDEQHVAEFDAALLRIKVNRQALENEVTPQLFPHLSSLLADAEKDLTRGRGFLVIRGFPIARYAPNEREAIFLGIGRLLGRPISQNSYGDLLGHVRDEGKRIQTTGELRGARGYRSNEALLFHTDLGDVVALLCVQKAIEGGLSTITSSMTVYNETLAHHPEYLPVYYRGFPYLNLEEGGDQSELRVPIYTFYNGVLSCAIRRNTIETARLNGVFFTDLEQAALKHLDETAAREDLRLDMDLEPGDIQLINNYTTLHSRTHFTDGNEPEQKRDLLRLWLQLPNGRSFLRIYPTIYDGIPVTLTRA